VQCCGLELVKKRPQKEMKEKRRRKDFMFLKGEAYPKAGCLTQEMYSRL
jgi:hypothetical protein